MLNAVQIKEVHLKSISDNRRLETAFALFRNLTETGNVLPSSCSKVFSIIRRILWLACYSLNLSITSSTAAASDISINETSIDSSLGTYFFTYRDWTHALESGHHMAVVETAGSKKLFRKNRIQRKRILARLKGYKQEAE
jgi:hypothetical protein